MPQISKGDTFTDGEQLTAARLNQLLDSAILTENVVLDQPTVSAPIDESGLVLILNGGVLSKVDLSSILNSGIALSTSSIVGQLTDGSVSNITIVPTGTGNKVLVIGSVEISTNLTVTGAASVGTSFYVTGATTLAGGISGDTTINGNVTIGSGKTLTLDSAPTTNLHAATKAYVDGTSLKSTNGYYKFPNGLIVQWGTHPTAMANYSVQTVTFPIAFPNACFSVQLTAQAVTAVANGTATLENGIKLNGIPTTTNFSVYINWSGSGASVPVYPVWLAIGH